MPIPALVAEGCFGRLKTESFHGRDWAGVTTGELVGMPDACLGWCRDVRVKGDLGCRGPMRCGRELGLAA